MVFPQQDSGEVGVVNTWFIEKTDEVMREQIRIVHSNKWDYLVLTENLQTDADFGQSLTCTCKCKGVTRPTLQIKRDAKRGQIHPSI